ncbi:MAG: guanylate kinase [Candidatus Omnitrophota bacterium]|nr:guanylate kinase [Candidatus Omnitrophota bacterium]
MRRQKKTTGKIFIISGPSGSGKTTLLKRALLNKSLKNKLAKSVSLTTRPKRSGEREGRDYFFVSPAEFRQLNKAKKILEWTRYLSYDYGTKRDYLEDKLKKVRHLALCLDLRGALKLKKLYPENAVTIFVEPPSINELRKRIEGRCSKTKPEEVDRRVKLAVAELKNAHRYDYILKNKNLAKAESRLKGIILKEIGV